MLPLEIVLQMQKELAEHVQMKNEAQILMEFVEFLANKTDKQVFNVPQGKI